MNSSQRRIRRCLCSGVGQTETHTVCYTTCQHPPNDVSHETNSNLELPFFAGQVFLNIKIGDDEAEKAEWSSGTVVILLIVVIRHPF